MEFDVALLLGFLYLTTKKSESQKGKLVGSLRSLFKVLHPQPPETGGALLPFFFVLTPPTWKELVAWPREFIGGRCPLFITKIVD